MSKAAVVGSVVGVGGTGAAGIYGAHHMGWFGGSGDGNSQYSDNKYIDIGKTVDEFQNSNGGHCLTSMFKQSSGEKISTKKSALKNQA